SSQSIVPTGNCTVTYTFTPTATGSRTANLVFTDNAAGSPHTVVLTGTGTAPTFSASTPAIPDTTLGSTSATQTETITNTGTADLTFGASAVAISGTNSSDFAIVADSCSSQSIVPTGYCTVTYTFTPTATGSRTANLVFTDNATGSPHTVVLTGTGTAPTLSASTPAIPNTTVNQTSATQIETITNTGTANLTFGASAVVLSGTNAGDFAIVADNCSSHSLTPSPSMIDLCTVTYSFTPTATGSRTANLVFTDNATGSPHTVVLTGTGTAPLSNDNTLASATIKGQSATLGTPSIAPGAATPGTVTISGTQSTSSTASVFTKSDPLAEVTRVVKYGFGASTSGFGTDTQYLDSDTISNRDFFVIQVKSESSRYLYYVINVTVASAGPGFSASAPNIPNTYIGSNSPTQTVTITNSGTANLVYGRRAVVLSGSNSSDFAIVADNCSNRSIAAARTCTVSFRFTPTSTGSRTANLVFTDNATGSPHTVVLTGTGVAAPLSISRLSESESGVRGGGRLTITGTGFANSATVTIGDVLAVVLQRSGTTGITVRIPAHARGIVSVVVTNPDLTSASIGGFRYR
ncbi:MAG: choice-of-anchor D domain-containing protein, partial [Actinobacteria bacterium]|nr:choice-of-anchor D domain-containing protein [Actinomycetota bacterium]